MKVGFPRVGDLTPRISGFLRDLDLDVIDPPPITEKTIQLGVRYSPDMMCFPYKVTLGNTIELAEAGADIVLQWNAGTNTLCRQKQYHRLQGYRMIRLGYQCRVMGITAQSFVRDLAVLSGHSKVWVRKTMMEWLLKVSVDNSLSKVWSTTRPNIGIIGEVYCCVEPGVNRNLYDLIQRHGGNTYPTVSIYDYFQSEGYWIGWRSKLKRLVCPDKFQKQAESYLEGTFAGHACENIANLLRLISKGVDGVIHVLPLTCMPESTIEEYVDGICEDNEIPLLRLPLDETNSPVNVETRVETFVKLILRRDSGVFSGDRLRKCSGKGCLD